MKGRPLVVALALVLRPALGADESPYPREHIYDTSVHPDEALVNVSVAFNRWPDCTTLESAIRDIFRLEGVATKRDEDKALALWKWFRILVSATGGAYAYELETDFRRPVFEPHKIFTVYGHHQCDGQSWAMVPLWRAAGYMALDQCHWGHTIASLRYRDDDGQLRYHDFDPQGRFYYWDETNKRVGTWGNPIMRRKVHRHVLTPQRLHSLRTSLRIGESIERKWDNEGHIVPHGKDKLEAEKDVYYAYKPGKKDGVYAAVGEEVQTFDVPTGTDFAAALYEGSLNTAATGGMLHPAEAGKPAEFIWRLAPPYIVADARIEATLIKTDPAARCVLSISTDGVRWQPVFTKDKTGEEQVAVNIGKEAWTKNLPHVYTAYNFFVKAELTGAKDVRSIGIKALKVTAFRQLNKRTLPNLRPGENIVRITADRLAPGLMLALEINYSVSGKPVAVRQNIHRFPHYLRIDVPDVPEHVVKNYDNDFNSGALQMSSIKMRLVRIEDGAAPPDDPPPELPEKFTIASPHPANMTRRKICRTPETDVRQSNGFFPQGDPGTLDDDAKMNELIKLMNGGIASNDTKTLGAQWMAVEDLGNYPKAVDALLAALPKANIDMTLFICKALARNPDKKAIGPLLAKWEEGEAGSPGTRYIPDVLAAIGDRSVVPALIAPLRKMRFDFRFHIAHALGILGGPEAEAALEDLAQNDPFPPVREEAAEGLKRLRDAAKRAAGN